jgi:hypothetical protein
MSHTHFSVIRLRSIRIFSLFPPDIPTFVFESYVRPGKEQQVMAGVFAAGHLLIGFCYIIRALFPPAPKEVTVAMKREQYLKQAI